MLKMEDEMEAINIVVDHTDPTRPIFVEAETDDGESVNIGKWIEYGDYMRLRITPADITEL